MCRYVFFFFFCRYLFLNSTGAPGRLCFVIVAFLGIFTYIFVGRTCIKYVFSRCGPVLYLSKVISQWYVLIKSVCSQNIYNLIIISQEQLNNATQQMLLLPVMYTRYTNVFYTMQFAQILFNPFIPSGIFYLNSLLRSISYIIGIWLVFIIIMVWRHF